jgi:hypothetical protein
VLFAIPFAEQNALSSIVGYRNVSPTDYADRKRSNDLVNHQRMDKVLRRFGWGYKMPSSARVVMPAASMS